MAEPFDDQWRELGFYCDHDTKAKHYRLIGSRSGLMRFASLLREYVADPRNATKSEHEHYGPWGLEVMTWPEAGMDDHAIHGPLSKLVGLADIVERSLSAAVPGQRVRIREEFSPAAEFTLVLDVRADGFDPPLAEQE